MNSKKLLKMVSKVYKVHSFVRQLSKCALVNISDAREENGGKLGLISLQITGTGPAITFIQGTYSSGVNGKSYPL
jgi:hypothetical protein